MRTRSAALAFLIVVGIGSGPSCSDPSQPPDELVTAASVAEATALGASNQVPVLPAGGQRAAASLRADVECEQTLHEGVAKLTWTVASTPGSEQKVGVTIFRGGFDAGNFQTSASLQALESSIVWSPLEGQAIHMWRVYTLHAEGWVPSEMGSFEAPTCAVDYIQPGEDGQP